MRYLPLLRGIWRLRSAPDGEAGRMTGRRPSCLLAGVLQPVNVTRWIHKSQRHQHHYQLCSHSAVFSSPNTLSSLITIHHFSSSSQHHLLSLSTVSHPRAESYLYLYTPSLHIPPKEKAAALRFFKVDMVLFMMMKYLQAAHTFNAYLTKSLKVLQNINTAVFAITALSSFIWQIYTPMRWD